MSAIDQIRVATMTANYNNGAYIGECIDSLLAQTRKPNLMVIVDDASTDNSCIDVMDKLERMGKIMPIGYKENIGCECVINGTKIIFIRKKTNSGAAATRNVALEYLMDKSDIIFNIDSDDTYYPQKIEKSLAPFFKYKEVAMVYTDYDVTNENKGTSIREYKEPFSVKRLYEECIVPNNSAMATTVFQKVGPFDESLEVAEDYDMWLRISDVAAIHHIPESLCQYRMTGNNTTVITPSQKFVQAVQKVHQKARERHGIKG